MKYYGTEETRIYDTAKELESLGLNSLMMHLVLILCGTKWWLSAINARVSHEHDSSEDVAVFNRAATIFRRIVRSENWRLSKDMMHFEEDKYLFLAMSEGLSTILDSAPISVSNWLKEGDSAKRRMVFCFSVGYHLFSSEKRADSLISNLVKDEYFFNEKDSAIMTKTVLDIIKRFDSSGENDSQPAN